MIALATSKTAKKQAGYVEDRIITIDLSTQEVTEIANFEELLPDLYQKATGIEEHSNNKGYLDPVHINSLQLTDNQQLLVSSRETSTILALKPDEQGIYQVEYMMGEFLTTKQEEMLQSLTYSLDDNSKSKDIDLLHTFQLEKDWQQLSSEEKIMTIDTLNRKDLTFDEQHRMDQILELGAKDTDYRVRSEVVFFTKCH